MPPIRATEKAPALARAKRPRARSLVQSMGSDQMIAPSPAAEDGRHEVDSKLRVLGQRVRIYRMRQRQAHTGRPWAQEDLAVAIGSDKAHVNRIECGRQRPAMDTLIRVSDALSLPWVERRRLLGLAGYLVVAPSPGQVEAADMARRVGGAIHHAAYPACLLDQNQRIWDVNETFGRLILGYQSRDACLAEIRECHLVEMLCAKRRSGAWLRKVMPDFSQFAARNLLLLQRALGAPERISDRDEEVLNDVLEDDDLCAIWLGLSAHLPDFVEPDYLDHQSLDLWLLDSSERISLHLWYSVCVADERFRVLHLVPADDNGRLRLAGRLQSTSAIRTPCEGSRSHKTMVSPNSAKASFPQRPITLTVPWAAGGSTDVCARILAPLVAQEIGRAVVVENRGGYQSSAEIERLARLPDDGYHLTFINQPAILSTLAGGARQDLLAEFRLIANQAYDPIGLFVRPESRYLSLRDVIRDATARNIVLSVGTSGPFTPSHLGALMLQKRTGLTFSFRHFRGSAEHIARYLAGQTDIAFLGTGLSLPALAAGDLRALALFTPDRFPLAPDVPTAHEGGVADLVLISTRGIWVRASVQHDVFAILESAFLAALTSRTHIQQMEASGFAVTVMDAVKYAQFAEQQSRYLGSIFDLYSGP